MTEAEYLECGDPMRLLAYLGAASDARKPLLLAAACFHRHWERLPEACRAWARLAESAAEGGVSRKRLDDAFEAVEEALNPFGPPGEFVALLDMAWGMWEAEWPEIDGDTAWQDERQAQAGLVREVFGNPFRPVVPDPAWRDVPVLSLAQAIYDGDSFDLLPILADALDEAGCTNADILSHCRQPGVHVRGCWVIDLLLGKE